MHEPAHSKQSISLLLLKLLLPLVGAIGFIMFVHQVPRALTPIDKIAVRAMVSNAVLETSPENYDAEIALIRDIQSAIFRTAPVYKAIPKNAPREPAHLVKAQHGHCFDRARSLDKALRMAGFKTRYAALYSTDKTESALHALFSKGGDDVRSHAAVEVLTERGWLVVDTVNPWLALDADNNPLSLADLQSGMMAQAILGDVYFIYKAPFTYVYGLYSRHGRAYPPYNFIPDVNWLEMMANF